MSGFAYVIVHTRDGSRYGSSRIPRSARNDEAVTCTDVCLINAINKIQVIIIHPAKNHGSDERGWPSYDFNLLLVKFSVHGAVSSL